MLLVVRTDALVDVLLIQTLSDLMGGSLLRLLCERRRSYFFREILFPAQLLLRSPYTLNVSTLFQYIGSSERCSSSRAIYTNHAAGLLYPIKQAHPEPSDATF